MTDTITPSRFPSTSSPSFILSIGAIVLAWLTLIAWLGGLGIFQEPSDQPPVAVLVAAVFPPLLFWLLMRSAPSFRRQVLAVDPVWFAAMMGPRVLGVGFLFLYAFGHLPGLFAHPAGWGDMTIGLLAPFIAVRLARKPSFLTSPWYWRYHALGMLDFAGAFGSALLARGTVPTAAILGDLPLVLIPAFAVPLWICLHLAAFAQIQAARKGAVA